MKQILIISGKGGTGKTVLTGALSALAKNKVLADCDVDAADLHLLLQPDIKERHIFKSGKVAIINKKICNKCGLCKSLCRFSAIDNEFNIDHIACEGCGLCYFACTKNAIEMKEQVCGEWFISNTRFGTLVHAKLGVASENSGKLVSLIRKNAKDIAIKQNADWIIIDGSPGIGCPVIASLSGVDCAIVVTESTLSGIHDAKRVIQTAKHFNIPLMLVINKFDININISNQIEIYCLKNNILLIGKIKFDKNIIDSVVNSKTIMEYCSSEITLTIQNIWHTIGKILK